VAQCAAEPLVLSFVVSEAGMSGSPENEAHRCSYRRVALGEPPIAQSMRSITRRQVPNVATGD
jgi:hypothetical protein